MCRNHSCQFSPNLPERGAEEKWQRKIEGGRKRNSVRARLSGRKLLLDKTLILIPNFPLSASFLTSDVLVRCYREPIRTNQHPCWFLVLHSDTLMYWGLSVTCTYKPRTKVKYLSITTSAKPKRLFP
ncbi:hypothetical protein BaRGS_00001630 [Batillaria attramentaria]|uniref:Uncharacterized protein n=1 Tax=Batillaria attramentaria TaxID=370345 RepID=A0ABD0M6X6_9CAEN